VAFALNSTAALAPPSRRQRQTLTDKVHDDTTLPQLRTSADDDTLTWHGRPAADDETKPSGAVRVPGYASPGQPAPTLPAPARTQAWPSGTALAAARSAVAQRPALWLGAAIIAVLLAVTVVLLFARSHSARSPAFRPNPQPTHTSAKPTPTTSPSQKASGSVKPTTSPTSGSQP
jgi:hypothetical protein